MFAFFMLVCFNQMPNEKTLLWKMQYIFTQHFIYFLQQSQQLYEFYSDIMKDYILVWNEMAVMYTTVQKFGVYKIKLKLLFSKDALNWQ